MNGRSAALGSAAWQARDDRGSGTVLALALVAVILVLAAGLGTLGAAQRARLGAQSAADLAALAAAGTIALPPGVTRGTAPTVGTEDPAVAACAVAAEVVARNRARLTGCEVRSGEVVELEVARDTVVGTATASARAGPASARAALP
ncbi:Rv3654c family TadE-like protein [Actinotalea sp. K2]|uniref:Rv3654c family TadE-like protein n=1 Tax=Actinotalea sp. K2 TaxID=2939438 RepID=UPI00201756B5|nr:Rv3654c family TadE-like protein [Actinotalea sp. K2]MCL3861374.1 pilus assembly protein TadG-related protein [Actinotalea sp. K2]